MSSWISGNTVPCDRCGKVTSSALVITEEGDTRIYCIPCSEEIDTRVIRRPELEPED